MTTTWIVVANASKALVYAVNKIKFLNDHDKLNLITEWNHPESRLRDSELMSDKLGRYHAKNVMRGDSFMEPTDPQKHEAEVFAREIAKELDNERTTHRFHELILVAPPTFYGLLNKHMHDLLKKMVVVVIEKDYTKDDQLTLEKHLKQQIG